MLNIDSYAYASALKLKDPMEKMTFVLLTLGVCLWADSIPISIAIVLIMSWVTVRIGRTPFPVFVRLMIIPASFLIIGVFTIAFGVAENQSSLLFSVPVLKAYIGVSKAGLGIASRLFFKAMGSVCCLYYLSLSTPMVHILATLRRLKCPKLLTEMMGLIYRCIFVLLETVGTMYTAQNSRLGYSGLKTGLRSMGALVSMLFIRSFKRADAMYTALEARGYSGELNVLEEPFQRDIKSYVLSALINIILVIAALCIKRSTGGFY